METKINKRIGFDSMSITGKMPSGASVSLKINRGGENLSAGLSNDSVVAKEIGRAHV